MSEALILGKEKKYAIALCIVAISFAALCGALGGFMYYFGSGGFPNNEVSCVKKIFPSSTVTYDKEYVNADISSDSGLSYSLILTKCGSDCKTSDSGPTMSNKSPRNGSGVEVPGVLRGDLCDGTYKLTIVATYKNQINVASELDFVSNTLMSISQCIAVENK